MEFIFSCRIVFSLLFISSSFIFSEAGIVGVNYGKFGNNLPSSEAVVSLLKSKNIDKVRLFNPDRDALNALSGSGIGVVVGVPNEDLQGLGNPATAKDWINANIVPYNNVQFRYIAVGNEVIPGKEQGFVFPAMQNINAALKAVGLPIPVSTAVSTNVIGIPFPPSKGDFKNEVASIMGSIVQFLNENRSPLLVNVYPYFSYIGNRQYNKLDYATFTTNEVVVRDDNLEYRNLFDAITDTVYSALEKVGGSSVDIVVTESGWPSDGDGGDAATITNARTYVNNLISHVAGTNGTPKRPGKSIETYIFALFNENQKSGKPTEQHFGLYYPNMEEVYPVTFL